jgi:hypothetical protein
MKDSFELKDYTLGYRNGPTKTLYQCGHYDQSTRYTFLYFRSLTSKTYQQQPPLAYFLSLLLPDSLLVLLTGTFFFSKGKSVSLFRTLLASISKASLMLFAFIADTSTYSIFWLLAVSFKLIP